MTEKEKAKRNARRIRKILNDASPLTRYYLAEFMDFRSDEGMFNPDIYEAIQDIEENITDAPSVHELRMGLELKPINVELVYNEEDSEIKRRILDDKSS